MTARSAAFATAVAALTFAAFSTIGTAPAVAQDDAAASDGATTFDFQDPKGVNGVVFVLESELEPIVGIGGGITGEVDYDPADPSAIRGAISLSAEGLQTSNARMADVMHGADWLGVSDHPLVTFEFVSAEVTQRYDDGAVGMDVQGELTLVGKTMDITVPMTVMHLPGKAKERGGADAGDLLRIAATMTIDRTDFGIKPDMDGSVVAENVMIRIPIVGYSK
jgi:polyisoprenoid-binding protein YceI